MGLRRGIQLPGHLRAQQHVAAEQLLEGGDLRLQVVALGLELDPGELRQAPQAQLEDVLGLHGGEVEDVHEPGARLLAVVGRADDLDDLVDVEDRDEQALDEVQAVAAALQAVAAAARDHADAVIEVDPQELAQAERLRLSADQGDVVDAEGVLERRQSVELLEHGQRVEAGLDADHEAQAVMAVGEVGDVGDAGELLARDARP